MDLFIRQATEEDLQDILRLYRQLGDQSGLSVEEAIPILRRMTSYPDYSVYVCMDAATVVGVYVCMDAATVVGTFALLIMDNLAHNGAPSAVVEDVCVDERHRRSGIGKAMMTFAMQTAATRHCYKLTLSSNLTRTNAHSFYQSLGFKQHGTSFYVPLPASSTA